jgi:hypothetical protein
MQHNSQHLHALSALATATRAGTPAHAQPGIRYTGGGRGHSNMCGATNHDNKGRRMPCPDRPQH